MDCMVALPGQLFYSTQIPVCLWFLARNKKNGKFRDRRGRDALHRRPQAGQPGRPHPPRTHRRRRSQASARPTTPGAARRAPASTRTCPASASRPSTEEIAGHGYVLTPGRYVGAEEIEDDGEPFDEKMPRLTATLFEQFTESAKLEKAIRENLKGLGYGG